MKGVGAVGAIALAPTVFAQSSRTVSFTLPWMAQGATAFLYVAQDQGMFKKRGINVEIARGFGSLAAGQAVANKQFDFGMVSTSSTLLCRANGLTLKGLATTNYEAYLGILVRADSPIKRPEDLLNKRLGGVPSSVEFPLWAAFAQRTGVDASKVEIVQADPRILERTLVEGQIDAAFCVASSSYAVAQGMGVDTRAMLLQDHGMSFYSNNIVTTEAMFAAEPNLCRDVTDAVLEGLAFTANDPEAAMGILLKKVPELALSKGGKENVRLSQGFMLASLPTPESKLNGLGFTDLKRIDEMTDLIMQYAAPKSAQRPVADQLFTNEFVGTQHLSDAQWTAVQQYANEFPKLLKGESV